MGEKVICRHCGKSYSAEEIEAKKKRKSMLISLARREARERGENSGAKRQYDYDRIRELRGSGLTIRAIARELGCSNTPVVRALKHPPPEGGRDE